MNSKDALPILVKVAGLSAVAFAVCDLPLYFSLVLRATSDHSIGAVLGQLVPTLIFPTILGLTLWFFPRRLLDRVASDEALSSETFGATDLTRAALSALGIWLATYGVVSIVFSALSTALMYAYLKQDVSLSDYYPIAISNVVRIAIGVALAFSARSISRLPGRARSG